MKIITKEERNVVLMGLLEYYRFLKKDARNHILNAIRFHKNHMASRETGSEEMQNLKKEYKEITRKITAVEHLKIRWNSVGIEEKQSIISDLIQFYDSYCFSKYQLVRNAAIIYRTYRKLCGIIPDSEVEDAYNEFENRKLSYRNVQHKLEISKLLLENLLNEEG